MMSEAILQEKNSLEQDDIDVAELVTVFAIIGRRLLGEIHSHVDLAILLQRKDERVEHLLEAKRVVVEMLGGILRIESNVRQDSTNRRRR